MVLLKIYIHSMKGFSLIEIMVVVGILIAILSLGLMTNLDSYRKYMFRSENQNLVSSIAKVRSESLTNKGESPHGICFDGTQKRFVLFQGNSYQTSVNTIYIGANPLTTISSIPNNFSCANGGVVFTQLSGTTTPIEIGVSQNGNVSTTTINYEGTIHW